MRRRRGKMGGGDRSSNKCNRDENQILDWHLENSEFEAVQQGDDKSRGTHQQTRHENRERTS